MLLNFDITQEASRLLLGIAYDRLYKFFMRYDASATQDNSHLLVQQLLKRLIDHDPTIHLYLYIDKGKAIGHILYTLETPSEAVNNDNNISPFLYIHQFEFDEGFADAQFIAEGLQLMDSIAYTHNANRILMTTARKPRAFKHYGFTTYRTVMVKYLHTNIDNSITYPIEQQRSNADSLGSSVPTEKDIPLSIPNTPPRNIPNGNLTLTPALLHKLQTLLESTSILPTTTQEEDDDDPQYEDDPQHKDIW